MSLSDRFIVSKPRSLFNSVIKSCEDCEDRPSRKNVMEVGDNVIGIMKGDVQSRIRKDNPGYTPDSKEKDKS